jgi:hypothetical protein
MLVLARWLAGKPGVGQVAGALFQPQGVTDEYMVPTVNFPDTTSTVSSVPSVT